MKNDSSRFGKLSFVVQFILANFLLLVMLPAQAGENSGFVPGMRLIYHFGVESGSSQLVFSAGWQHFRRDSESENYGNFDLARIQFRPARNQVSWSVAGMQLHASDTGASDQGELSTQAKWGIGLGLAAALIYVASDKVGDNFGDTLEDGFTPRNNRGDEQPEDDGGTDCLPGELVCP